MSASGDDRSQDGAGEDGGDSRSDAADRPDGSPDAGSRADAPSPEPGTRPDGGEPGPGGNGPRALIHRFRTSDNEVVVFVREMLSSAAIVVAIGLVLFGVSGVWPPMVAIESGSMTPHMHKGDLVFIMDDQRLVPDAAHGDTGVVTYADGQETGYKSFHGYGDVVVYKPDGHSYETPIIHRARFWVEDGENWYDEANEDYIPAGVDSCEEVANCPAPHAGFVTKGDANGHYDQVGGTQISDPVKPNWIRGTAEVRVPWLGWVRLKFSGAA